MRQIEIFTIMIGKQIKKLIKVVKNKTTGPKIIKYCNTTIN